MPQAELDDLRRELELLTLPDTCAILTRTVSVDAMGAPVETWGTATASIACRLDHRQGGEQIQGGSIQPYFRYVLTLPYDAEITPADRVKHAGIIYAVKSVSSGSLTACIRCELEKIG